MARGLFSALEELENEVTGDDVSNSELMEAEVADNESQQEVDQSVDELSEAQTTMEEAEQEAENVEDIAEVVEDSVENGEGLDSTSAELVETAVEAIAIRLGIKNTKSVISLPSMESFGSSSSRLAATKIALENIKEWATKIWEHIKKMARYVYNLVLKMIDAVMKLWKNREGYINNLINTAQTLKNKNAELKSDKKEIELNKHHVDIFNDIKAKTALTLVSEAIYGSGNSNTYNSSVSAAANKIAALYNAASEGTGKLTSDKLDAELVSIKEAIRGKVNTGVKNYYGAKLTIENKGDGDKEKTTFYFDIVSDEKSSERNQKVAPASLNDIITTLKKIKDDMASVKRASNDQVKVMKDISATFDKKTFVSGNKEEGAEDKESIEIFKKLSNANSSLLSSFTSRTKVFNQIFSFTTLRGINVSKKYISCYEPSKGKKDENKSDEAKQ